MNYLSPTIAGVILGTLARYFMLRSDYRQYPTYPHGVVTHLSLAFIGSILGAIAIPAFLEKEFAAIAFLSMAATQFRDVREMERRMLSSIEQSELVPRGADYIEGIARVFEARNYLVILIAMIVSGVGIFTNVGYGSLAGLISLLFANKLMQGKVVGQIAKVREGGVRFEGPNLFVDEINFMNLAMEKTHQTVLQRALGVVIEPFDDDARATLANTGQRQAIAHDAAALLGIYRDVDTAEFTPLVRRDLETGRIGLIILPIEKDIGCLIKAVKNTPVLESAQAKPLKAEAGKEASD